MPAEQMFDLYWLGYLLTGDREQSVQAVIETLETPDATNPLFKSWMASWSRKSFIAKVLGYGAPPASTADLRAQLRHIHSETGRVSGWAIDPTAGRPELEQALLAIEPLPRRALVLSVFEKLTIEDVRILLGLDRESVIIAKAIGLIELARNLAGNRKSQEASALGATPFAALQEVTA